MSKIKESWPKYFVILMLVTISFSVGVTFERARATEDLEAKLEVFLQVLDIVKNDYVEKNLDNTKIVYGSIRGLLDSLDDPYSRFMDPSAFKEMKIRMSGSYSGIGIYIGIKDKYLTVISPIPGTPAFKMGLKPGDKIITIDKKLTKDMALEEAVSLIRGQRGTSVVLGILRGNAKEPKDMSIIREKIVIESVESKFYEKSKVAYIKLNTFENQKAAIDMKKALNKAKSAGARGLILDVRNNGGGLLQNAVDIGSMFIKKGAIVYTVDRDGNRDVLSSTGAVAWDKPVVVLINGSSASASEILAGALRDNNVAQLVGTHSFGKASVQNVRQLSDGSCLLITIAKYLTPNGEDINKKGIQPDILVEVPTPEADAVPEIVNEENDIQLDKALEVINAKIKSQQ